MKILLYQFWKGNAYSERMAEILRGMGHDVVPAARPGPLLWARIRPDCLWLNTPERYAVSGHGRSIRPLRLLALLLALLVMKARRVLVVSVEHNWAVHDAGAKVSWIGVKLMALVRKIADIRMAHADVGAGDGGNCHYVPHPLYRLHPAVALPEAFSPEVRCMILGRIAPYKRLEDTLRWWPADVPLLIAGACSNEAYVEQLKAIVSGKNVRFRIGRLSSEELDSLLAGHDIVVVPHGESSNIVSGTFFHAVSAGCLVLGRQAKYLASIAGSGFPHLAVYGSEPEIRAALAQLRDAAGRISRGQVLRDAQALFGDAVVAGAVTRALGPSGKD